MKYVWIISLSFLAFSQTFACIGEARNNKNNTPDAGGLDDPDVIAEYPLKSSLAGW